MRRFVATMMIAAIGVTVLVVGQGTAPAADLEITPAAPDEGDTELTIEITAFEPDTPIYAVPCVIRDDGSEPDVATDDCDLMKVAAATTDGDGKATIVVNWEIPAEGIAVFVGDEARDNQVSQVVTPEAAIEADDSQDSSAEVAVLGSTVVREDLADTGPREVVTLAMAATALIVLGLALRGAERLQTPA
jgi:hypothetical protein